MPTTKAVFPYSFSAADKLDYIGALPDYRFFDPGDISFDGYKELAAGYVNRPWEMRTETLDYLMRDFRSLYEIIR